MSEAPLRSYDLGNGLTVEYQEQYHCGGEIRLLHENSGLRVAFKTAPLEVEVDEDTATVTFFNPQVSTISISLWDDERCADAADSMGLPFQYFLAALAGKFTPL